MKIIKFEKAKNLQIKIDMYKEDIKNLKESKTSYRHIFQKTVKKRISLNTGRNACYCREYNLILNEKDIEALISIREAKIEKLEREFSRL